MQPDMAHVIQFINVTRPSEGTSPQSRRQAHSHAAREAHARARRLRTARYQAREAAQHGGKDQEEVVGEGRPPGRPELATPEALGGRERALVVPSPVGLLPSDRRGYFANFAGRFRPVEHFLIDHYVRDVIPYLRINCHMLKIAGFEDLMLHEWVRLALTDEGFLSGLLLAACRNLCRHHYREEYFDWLAMRYKLTCIRTLSMAVSSDVPVVSDVTVAQAIALALDEIALGDLTTVRHHVKGAVKMVQFKGGPQTLGLNGCLELLFNRLIRGASTWERNGQFVCEEPQPADSLSIALRSEA